MEERGFTENTQQAFRLDMELLVEYLGAGVQLDRIAPANLNAFLKWMEEGQGKNVSCSPKTMERRITTLKVFFGWLAETGVLRRDPAAPLIHQAVSTPLPEVLRDPEVEAMLAVTGRMRKGGPEEEGDPRPHLLTTLVLHTGIKKGETVRIALNHIDLTNPNSPALWVRYKRPSRRHKERRIALPVWWPTILREYLDAYAPRQHLFPWTARNLEYVLTKVAREAGLQRLTFEMLRWTCAVHDYVEGMDLEALRHKLGLSEISWYETEGKLALLAQHFGGRSEPSPSS
jgi:integrase/recombinase XerD